MPSSHLYVWGNEPPARPGDSGRGGRGALILRMRIRVRISDCIAAANASCVPGPHLDIALLAAMQSLSRV